MKLYSRSCMACDRLYASTKPTSLTCSDSCRKALSRLRKRRREARLRREGGHA